MTRRRLTLSLTLFFLALAIPTSILVYQAYGQLKWEAFYQHQRLAREFTLRIDSGFRELIEREERRPISDYEFLNVSGDGEAAFLQRSPLSQLPLQADVPGTLGYFQVDGDGQLRTPILPDGEIDAFGISDAERHQRQFQLGRIRDILGENRLVRKGDASGRQASADLSEADAAAAAAPLREAVSSALPMSPDDKRDAQPQTLVTAQAQAEPGLEDTGAGIAQSSFDQLSTRESSAPVKSRVANEQVKDLNLLHRYQVGDTQAPDASSPLAKTEARRSRKEQVNLPQSVFEDEPESEQRLDEEALPASEALLRRQPLRIETFESEVEPMEFALLDSGHFVLFRRVWHRDQRYVQGLLIDQRAFIDGLIEPAFRESSLSSMSALIVAWRGDILRSYAASYSRLYQPSDLQQGSELLYQARLVAPFGDIELIYTLARLPIGAGGQVILWSALVIGVVLVGGCLMLLRLGQRQLALARQQQDFVSAVSHELKTPLTSIRMYGEILRAGWVDEEKRKSYYDFIFHEAERLTRLINNVLQLARLSRNEQSASIGAVSVAAALDELRPRLESQLEASGFELGVTGEEGAETTRIEIDIDWFIQIFINLVDNAVKFSANAEARRVDIAWRRLPGGGVQFSVRDYGPGIEPGQMKKIFTLFYRAENELTRETVGTGIGLALVHQLATAMGASVDVVNAAPGAEFRICFRAESTG